MIGLIRRVSSANVSVGANMADEIVGKIGRGLVLLLGVEKKDNTQRADRLLNKVVAYRVFPDDQGHMNLSLGEVNGDLLIVSQFTIAADTHKGLRPSFSAAAAPALAEKLYDGFVQAAADLESNGICGHIATGRFGADMQLSLVGDGPVTFLLQV